MSFFQIKLFIVDLFSPIVQPMSMEERERVRKSPKEAIQLFDKKLTKTLPTSLVDEAITLSDLFSMSELQSAELLLEAEEQMQYFHGFNRGSYLHQIIILKQF